MVKRQKTVFLPSVNSVGADATRRLKFDFRRSVLTYNFAAFPFPVLCVYTSAKSIIRFWWCLSTANRLHMQQQRPSGVLDWKC